MGKIRPAERRTKVVARAARATQNAPADKLSANDRLAEDLAYLRDSLLYWFYERADRKRSRRYADLLEQILNDLDEDSIVAQECRSLVAEVRGNVPKAIRHRIREIKLIRRLHQISAGRLGEDYVLSKYGIDDLSDRLDLLAILYHALGKRERALKALSESRRLCEAHGIPFDGADLWDEYQRQGTRRPAQVV
jgi:hypothetical protein